jgi:hypothetical protein
MRSTNRMRTVITGALLCILVVPGFVSAQDDLPNLQGRWTIVRDRCIPPQMTQHTQGGMTGVPIRMDIEMEGNKVTIERRNELRGGARNEFTEVFAIDGEPWPQEFDGGDMTITAEWKNDTIVLTRAMTTTMGERQMQTTQTEMWSYVEQDGQVGMAISIQPSQRAMPGAAAGGARPGGSRTGGKPGGGGRGGATTGVSNIILVFELKKR